MLLWCGLAGSLLLSTTALAQDYATRDVGPWVVAASSDRKGCFLTRTFQGERGTTLLFGLDVDDSSRLTLLNPNWSIREKEQHRLNFRLSNASFSRHPTVGIAAEGKNGFVASFGAAFPSKFAASKYLHIARADVPVEELSLEGSGAAVAELRRCVDLYRTKRATVRSRDGNTSRIPVDPFAAAGKKRD